MNTLINDEFQEYIQDKVCKRESELIKNKNLKVCAPHEIIDIIKRSKAVSTSKGKSHILLRTVINKKSKKQEELKKQIEEVDSKYLNELHNKLEEMKNAIKGFEEMNEEAFENKGKLVKLYQLGIIDSDREPKEEQDKTRL